MSKKQSLYKSKKPVRVNISDIKGQVIRMKCNDTRDFHIPSKDGKIIYRQ